MRCPIHTSTKTAALWSVRFGLLLVALTVVALGLLMAFPGEEPPQIECNEDAGGQDTDE